MNGDLADFERFPNLEHFYCSEIITDAGLASLAKMSNLKTLDLSEAEISDEGLLQLASLKRLTQLHLGNNANLTEDGVNRLRELLPDCKIDYWRRQQQE